LNCRHFAVVSLFPDVVRAVAHGVVGRAHERGLFELQHYNPRDFSMDPNGRVDDRPFGGGPGMVMQVEPLEAAVRAANEGCRQTLAASGNCAPRVQVVFMSPQGRRLDAELLGELGENDSLTLVAGRYEGVDERFIEQHVDREVSVGDYVLSGGELPAMVVIDALVRQIPGALGHRESAAQDSASYKGVQVPEVLTSGDHQAIARWRRRQALARTLARRPDLLDSLQRQGRLGEEDIQLLRELKRQSGA